MTPPRAFDFTGDVAIVTGAGSRMDGQSTDVTAPTPSFLSFLVD